MNEEEEEGRTCEPPYRMNCKWEDIRCCECRALHPEKKTLHYSPLSPSPSHEEHPAYTPPDKAKIQRGKKSNRDGRRTEKKVIEALPGGQHNKSSIGYDGRLRTPVGDIRIEVKRRGESASMNPSRGEKDKARRDGVDAIITTRGDNQNEGEVWMTLTTFRSLFPP